MPRIPSTPPMLPPSAQDKGRQVLSKVVLEITNDRDMRVAQGTFEVTAQVNGEIVFHGQVFCQFILDHNDARISVYWEEAGLKNYRQKGLFGQMSTNFQTLRKVPSGVLEVIGLDKNYTVFINYKS